MARHVGGGSDAALPHGAGAWVERNTLLLVARAFPARWLPFVAYRDGVPVAAGAMPDGRPRRVAGFGRRLGGC